MQSELNQMDLDTPIWILGINEIGYEAYNDYMTFGRNLPWLQDTASAGVWASWEVTYRDVVIVDSSNCKHAVYNLTDHDLSDPDNYDTLKQMLLDAAAP